MRSAPKPQSLGRRWAVAHVAIGALTVLSALVTLLLSGPNTRMIVLALEGMSGFLAFFGIAILTVLAIGIALVAGGIAALRDSRFSATALRFATTLSAALAAMALLVPSLFVFARTSNPDVLGGGTMQAEMASRLGWRVASFCLQAVAYPFVLLLAQRRTLVAIGHGPRRRGWLIAGILLALPALLYCGFLLLGAAGPSHELFRGTMGGLVGVVFVIGLMAARFVWPLVLVCAIGSAASPGAGAVQSGVLWALAILACVVGFEAWAFR